jgi:hypothetical protein
MPPGFGTSEGGEAMFKLSIEAGFGFERFGRVRCVVTHADLQPTVAACLRRPGDSTWRAMAPDALRIEDGLITEIVVFPADSFLAFRLPMVMGSASGDGQMSLAYSMLGEARSFSATPAVADRRKGDPVNRWSPYF